jgi:hypothetical protein
MFQLIDQVSTLTISGGEPTLAMETLEYIRQCIIYSNCGVGNFYMVTNGKSIHVDEVAEWAYLMLQACDDNEFSTIGFSFDQFHGNFLNSDQVDKRRRNFYNLQEKLENDYGVYDIPCGGSFITKHSDENWTYSSLISEGRAKDFGSRKINIYGFEEDSYLDDDDIRISDNEVYLSSTGFIVAGCDWSFNSIDKRKDIRIAHIDDIHCTDDLIEAIRAYNKTVKKEEAVA